MHMLKKTPLLSVVALLFALSAVHSQEPEQANYTPGFELVQRSNPKTVSVSYDRFYEFDPDAIRSIIFCHPLPESNSYQDISLTQPLPGETLRYSEREGKYQRLAYRKNEVDDGRIGVRYGFSAAIYDTWVFT